MDLSKLCINVQDGDHSPSSSRISLPPMTEIHNDNNNNVHSNIIVYPTNSSLEYQQRYQLRHQHLKQYFSSSTHSPPTTSPSLPPLQQQQQQQQNEFFYHSNNIHSNPTPQSIPLPGLATLPSISTTTASSTPTDEIVPNSLLISQLLEQCNTIYTRIGKYRVDPLTESERSKIIDQVYFTAEKMLQSIQQLHSDENQLSAPPTQSSFDAMETQPNPTENTSSSQSTVTTDINNQAEDMDEYKMIRQARNLQDSNARPKYRRRSKRSMIGQRCHSCNTTETPEWRRGPDGARTLCNACGLHYSKLLRKGSMTVQTHNYLIEGSSPEYKKVPRIIQYPIIQVNSNNDNNTATSMQQQQQQQQQQQPFMRKHTAFGSNDSISRITEVYSDEEMTDNDNNHNNKMEDGG